MLNTPAAHSPIPATEPQPDCDRCPRLARVREDLRVTEPEWWNAPVPAFGDGGAWLAIIGLAPGRRGANRTGRAFTGDASGDFLFAALARSGLYTDPVGGDAHEGAALAGVMILNAVRCLPPDNRPVPAEIHACRPFLAGALAALPRLTACIALGEIAHQSAIKALGGKLPKCRFAHGAIHRLPSGATVIDSYHCSRLNTNTGRLTVEMFDAVIAQALTFRPG